MSPKLKHKLVKAAVSIGIATVIGYTIKLEKKIHETIDDNYHSNND
jgi:hypothetical protein